MAEVKPNLITLEELEFEDPIPVPANLRRPIAVRPMVLMGTGPTNPSKRVIEALCKPTMGIYTPEFHQVCHNQKHLLNVVLFRCNRWNVFLSSFRSQHFAKEYLLSLLFSSKSYFVDCLYFLCVISIKIILEK